MIRKITAEIRYNTLIIRIPLRVITVLDHPAESIQAPILFTARQQQFFELLLIGKAHKEIADVLHVSEGRAKQIACDIYKKLGVSDRTQLIRKFSQPMPKQGLTL